MTERGFTMSQSINRGKPATLSLVVLLVCSFGQVAVSEDVLGEEQVAKLVAAVWKDKPDSIDATIYATITRPAEPYRQIRERVEGSLAKDRSQILERYEANSRARTIMLEKLDRTIEMNVEKIVKEQQTPNRMKMWIRMSGGRERHDVAYAWTPDVPLGPNTPFKATFVSLGKHVEGDIRAFSYHHDTKTADIHTRGWKPSRIEELTGLPPRISIGWKMILGRKTSSGLYVPDPDKIQKVKRTGLFLGKFGLTIVRDPNAPATRDRIELRGPDYRSGPVLICDRNDYSRVYSMKSYLRTTGHLSRTRVCSNFDSQGFPHNSTIIEYDVGGKLKKKEVYRVKKLELNPVIPNEVFEFRPPEGYTVQDLRTKKAETTKKPAPVPTPSP